MLSLSSKEVLQLESDYNTDDIDDKESLEEDMSYLLNTLKDREKDILKSHFGIGEVPMSIGEIATLYNLSYDRVRQIREKALRRLRFRSRVGLLKKYVREKDIVRSDMGYITGGNYASRYGQELTRENNKKKQRRK